MTPVQESPMPPAAVSSVEAREWSQPATETKSQRRTVFAGLAGSDWIVGLLFLAIDVVSWIAIYGVTTFLRSDNFLVGACEFFPVDVVQLVVICQALFMIGGYDRNNDTRTLTYMAEQILGMAGAAAISSLLVYAAATFDSSMKPSRSAVLVSFLVFLPWSLVYRRLLYRFIAESTAGRAFLVIGSGEIAARFYAAYRQSPTRQRLEFVDLEAERVGQHIAGPDSPLIEGNLTTKLGNLSARYSGVILAERVDRLQPDLLEHLVRTQFQRARVYTLESFYEAHWRHVPVHSIDPFWPLQMGFQLSRNSPYHYLKRLFDVVVSAVLLALLWPLLLLLMLIVWVDGGRPAIFRQERVGREGKLFTAFKLRTMRPGTSGDDESGDIYTRANDPRITRAGRWLRKLRLDELPQLFNVLRGDMSLIGPRAEWIKCTERY